MYQAGKALNFLEYIDSYFNDQNSALIVHGILWVPHYLGLLCILYALKKKAEFEVSTHKINNKKCIQ